MKRDKIILGIDPGTNIMGYGAIHLNGSSILLLGAGVVSMQQLEDHPLKLKRIFESTLGLIEQYKPDELAIEAPFFGKNVQSMLKLGRAQGIAIAAALTREIPIFEYAPRKIKQSITGNGNASKEQVAAMLEKIITPAGLKGSRFQFTELKYLDATDALGVALCHYFHQNIHTIRKSTVSRKKKLNSWQSFVSENPGRVKK